MQVDELPETEVSSSDNEGQMHFAIESDEKALCCKIEALLFVCSEALSIKQLAKLCDVQETAVAAQLQRITEEYADRGIIVREVAGGFRFATASQAREAVEAYLLPPKTHLSTPALETLAIVAYLQPITKGEIEAIRGVSADSVVATLLDRQFLTEAGRKDVVGRPILYKTTPDFLEAFGLRTLAELPPLPADMPLQMPLNVVQASPAVTESSSNDAG